jgi:murein DD-endopeptidase MepM/ murein hydrolase activator NlpD
MNRHLWAITASLCLLAAGFLGLLGLICPRTSIRPRTPIGPSPLSWPTFSLIPSTTNHLFTQGTTALWQSGAAEAIDPFGGQSLFTLHLNHYSDGDWCYPLPGANVISPYGERDGRIHTGTDIKTTPGDTIRAAFSGVVTMSAPFSDYGNCVQIRHSNGLTTLYSHNDTNLVNEGQAVRAGQPIALEGRTGRATTEHLHFEIRVAGQAYNSEMVFDHDNNTLRRHKLVFRRNGEPQTKSK